MTKNKCIDLWVNIAQINLGIHIFRLVLTGGILPNNSKVTTGQTGCLHWCQVIWLVLLCGGSLDIWETQILLDDTITSRLFCVVFFS